MPPIPPLKYSNKAEHMPDGTEIRRLEVDDNFERHQNARISNLEHEVAALAQFDAEPIDRKQLYDLALKKYKAAVEIYAEDHETALLNVIDEVLFRLSQSDAEASLSDQMYGFHGAGFDSTTPLPQSDAEPVAWQFKPPFEIYNGYTDIADATGHICTAESPEIAKQFLTILNATYAAPSRPDASAGLIEALADDLGFAEWATPADAQEILRDLIAKYHGPLRARAADRSGK